jgi:hypothetical protein
LQGIRRVLLGDKQQAALQGIVSRAIDAAVDDIVAADECDDVRVALHRDGPDSAVVRIGDIVTIRGAVTGALGQRLEILAEQGYTVNSDNLIGALAQHIVAGIEGDANRGGLLTPLAERLRHERLAGVGEETVRQLRDVNRTLTVIANSSVGGDSDGLTTGSPQAVSAAKDPAAAPFWMPTSEEIDGCLAALHIPIVNIPIVAEWVNRKVDERLGGQSVRHQGVVNDFPLENLDESTRQAVRDFVSHLMTFLQPETILASALYVSHQKIARMYDAYRGAIQERRLNNKVKEVETSSEKFRLVYRYLGSSGRLASATVLSARGEVAASWPESLIYFSGDFILKIDEAVLAQIPDAAAIIRERDEANMNGAVSAVFESWNPYFLPIVRFDGRVGPQRVVVVASRKYFSVQSHTITALGRALLGGVITLSGFGMLQPSEGGRKELQPVAFTISRDRRHRGR